MKKEHIFLGEMAGLSWLCADAAWAIGDRFHLNNSYLMTFLFACAIMMAIYFIYLQLNVEVEVKQEEGEHNQN